VKRFRGGLVFKAHRLVYHSTLGLRVIKKKMKGTLQHFLKIVPEARSRFWPWTFKMLRIHSRAVPAHASYGGWV